MSSPQSEARIGIAYGLAAAVAWGLLPIYWRFLRSVPAPEILCHRVIWSALFVAVLLAWRRRTSEIRNALKHHRTRWTLFLSSALIGGNWLLFIWAVQNGKVLQASMGYFLSPLMSVLLGRIILKERLHHAQAAAVVLAALGVINLMWRGPEFPFVAMTLVVSFAIYGLLRKTAPVDSLLGLAIETVLLVPFALIYLVKLHVSGENAFISSDGITRVLLIGAGMVTALPLLWFAHAARRLRLISLGFLQYIAPSLQFMLAVVLYGEPFTDAHLLTFSLIWIGLAIYSVDSVRRVVNNA